MVEANFSHKMSRFRCDNGRDYENKEFWDFCDKRGIQIETTSAYTPQQNRKSEWLNRTLI